MPTLTQAFNARNVEPQGAMSQLPVGSHLVIITHSAIEPTKDKSGGLVKYELSIADGPLRGMTGAYRINLYNASQKAVEIAQKQQSALCHVCGVPDLQATEQLHNVPFVVVVGPQDDPKYTQITGVRYADGSEVKPGQFGSQGPAQTPQQQAPAQQTTQQAPAAAWGGGQPAQQQSPAQQQAPAAAWGQPPATQAPAQQGGAPAWSQGGQPGGAPAWGQK